MFATGFTLNSTGAQNAPRSLISLSSLVVKSNIKHRYAHTTVCSEVCNNADTAQEVTFSMTLPETAFISSFSIEIDGKIYDAYVKEKEEAKRVYTEAVQLGRTAAHVAVSTRDSNQFTVSVNVEPHKAVMFRMTYEELLSRKLGIYRHIINLDPGQIVQELSVLVNIEESSDITQIHVPPLRTSDEQPITSTGISNEFAAIDRPNPHTAVIKFAPTPEQQRLMSLNGIKGQLILQYDVDRTTLPSQILVNDGYFAHYFAPEELNSLPKHVTFVLDISGSMQGRKINQLKEAMEKILGDLHSQDYFSLIAFNHTVKIWRAIEDGQWDLASAQETDWKNLVLPATRENILKGKLAILKLTADGSTNIYESMMLATNINLLGKKVQLSQTEEQSSSKHLEPLIIFLTDGQPTCSICNKDEIISETTRLNQMSKSNIFALGLGNDVDFDFLKKLALRNSGFCRKIYEASDTALQLTDFYKEVASPLLSNITFIYQPEQVVPTSLTRKNFFTFFRGSELIVSGRIDPSIPEQEFHFTVSGTSSEGTKEFQPRETRIIFLDNAQNKTGFMERLWAYLTIQQLLEEGNKHDDQMASDKKRQAIQLALKYSFVTPVTSLVVVRPDEVHRRADLEMSGAIPLHNRSVITFGSVAPQQMSASFRSNSKMVQQQQQFSPLPAVRYSARLSTSGSLFGSPSTPSFGTFGSSQQTTGFGSSNSALNFPSVQHNQAMTGFSFGSPQTGSAPQFLRPRRRFEPSDKKTEESIKKHFTIERTLNTATCKICHGVITGDDPKRLEKHMENAHPDLKISDDSSLAKRKQVSTEEDKSKPDDTSPTKKHSTEKDSSNAIKPITVILNEQSFIDACMDMVTVDGRPLSIFNDSGLKQILEPINDGLNLPGSSITVQLIQKKIDDQSSELDDNLYEEMKGALVSLKLETITRYKRIFLAIHAQYFQNGKMNLQTLAIKELKLSYNQYDLELIIFETLEKYHMKPEDVLYITVNNSTNVPKFSKQTLAEEDTSLEDSIFAADYETKFLNIMLEASSAVGIPGFVYPLHTLELAIYDALKMEEVTIAKAKETVEKLKTTPIMSSSLKTVTYIPTRLDKIYNFLETFLHEVSTNQAIKQSESSLPNNDCEAIKSIQGALSVLMPTLQNLHESNCCLDDMYSLWMGCQEKVAKCGTKFSEILSTNMKKRIGEVLENALLLSTVFLFPKYDSILNDNQKSTVIEELEKLWLRMTSSKEDRKDTMREKLKPHDSSAQLVNIKHSKLDQGLKPDLCKLAVALALVPALQNTEQRLFSNLSFLVSPEEENIREKIVKLRCYRIFNNAQV